MGSEVFFVITVSDGDVYIRGLLEKELLDELTPNKDGYAVLDGTKAAHEIPNTDPMYWHDKFIIIKGEIVVPKPKQVVSRYEL